jgi:glycosyltransferase involved in cell wall biosynthesis
MKNILIIYPYNKRAIDQISSIELLSKKNKVFLMILDKYGPMHSACAMLGINIVKLNFNYINNKNKILRYFYLIGLLIKLIKNNNIQYVFSHLETSCFIANIASFFCKFNHYYFKHNTDAYISDSNIKGIFLDYLANKLSNKIICISKNVYEHLVGIGIKKEKLKTISYGYNFSYFKKPKYVKKKKVIRFICIGRFVKSKRIELCLKFFNLVKIKEYNKKLTVLGDGPLKNNLQNRYNSKEIDFVGFQKNPEDFISRSDILVHFSESESFGHVVLEAAFQNKTIIACNNVGTFNTYIANRKTGYLVSKKNSIKEALDIFKNYSLQEILNIGKNLSNIVQKKYNINNFEKLYNQILNEKK